MIKRFDEYKQPPVMNDYVAVREDSTKYNKETKNIIYQITLWNSEDYYLADVFSLSEFGDLGWVKWRDARHLNNKELKKLDFLLNIKKYNI